MKTYLVTTVAPGTNRQQLEIIPSGYAPNFILTTDFVEIGIISKKIGNAGMIEAIHAVESMTNCMVLTAKAV